MTKGIEIEIGQNESGSEFFIASPEENYSPLIKPFSKRQLTCLAFSKEDCRWIIEALKKELGEDYEEDILNQE